MSRALLLLLCAGSLTWAAPSPCEEMYSAVLKGNKKAQPADVGELYMRYCKKNMRVSSAKSMDELCAPMVKKVEEKMRWVPPDTPVTPPLVCLSLEKIKEKFPEYAAEAEENSRRLAAEEAQSRRLLDVAKGMQSKLSATVKSSMDSWEKELVKDLGSKLRAELAEALADEAPAARSSAEALAKQFEDAASLSSRGMQTKLLQKLEELLGGWLSQATRAEREEKKRLAAESDKSQEL
mmetsp:Transcript_4278/g.6838  ORF Transcript_4278/g.6838 Transcript_4278/m.6838 type:complete len:237 (+) Transcript_4278:75-785(+)